jgi:outer membrane protein assembly factor BamB
MRNVPTRSRIPLQTNRSRTLLANRLRRMAATALMSATALVSPAVSGVPMAVVSTLRVGAVVAGGLSTAGGAWLAATPAHAAAPEANWPTFRGADRSAVSSDTGLLQEWPADGPKLLWETKGAGRGYASLAVAGGKLFTLGDGDPESGDGDKTEYLSAFSLDDGKLLWKTETGSPWNSGAPTWQGSRSTPTVDGERVYVVTPFGKLFCCDVATGKSQWSKDLKEEFGGKKGDGWGYSESVLVDGDKAVFTPGGDKNTMVAVDKVTGEVIWKTAREGDRGAGHASIVIADIGGTRVYVTTTASGAMGVRATDGKLLWSYEIDRTTAVIPTPIVRGDLVFFAAGYKRGGALLKQVAQPENLVKIEEIYPIKPALANKHGGIVLVGDHLFGDSDDAGVPFCASLMTGEIVWKERGSGRSSAAFAAADGCLYIRFQNGVVALAKATPDGYKETGSFKIPGNESMPSWSHPVITGGRLFLREQDRILCYDVTAKK